MNLKPDENLSRRARTYLELEDFDVQSVADQDLIGASDETIVEICRVEVRCLITLDLGLSNTLRYPPSRFAGIAVLRVGKTDRHRNILTALQTLVAGMRTASIAGKLWIVSPKRIREYQPR